MTHALLQVECRNSVSNRLLSKEIFDNVEPINAKATVGAVALRGNSDIGVSDTGIDVTPIISHAPNSYKKRGASMSKNFVQLLRSKDTLDLLQDDPKAFLLLTYISIHASRGLDETDILQSSECFLSEKETPKKCGLTTKEYRGAKTRLINQEFIEEVYNPTWFRKTKDGKPRNDPGIEKWKKRAIKRAINSCVVRLCDTRIYDINEKTKGDQKGDQRAIKGRSKGDIQEGKEDKEDKKKTTPLPPKGGEEDVSFSNRKKREDKILVHRDVYLTPQELEECIQIRGSLDTVKEVIDNILDWPDRKYPIREWAKNIKKWTLKNLFIDKRAENEQLVKTLESQFSYVQQGWGIRFYRDTVKDDLGALFECHGSAYSKSIFISCSVQDFKDKVYQVMREKNMKIMEKK